MARPNKTDIHGPFIIEARKRGRSPVEIAADLTARGFPIKSGAVGSFLRRVKAGGPRPAAPTPAPEPAPQSDQPEAGNLEDELRASIRQLRELAAQARTDNRDALFVQCQRAIKDISALVARITPPPPPDPNEDVNVRASAEQAKRDLRDAVRTAVEWNRLRQ